MIRLVIMGQPFWSRRLAEILNQRRGEVVTAEFLAPARLLSPAGFAAAMRADIFLRMGYRPGAPTWRGRLFDVLWALLRTLNPGAKGVHYWLGTDVLNTLTNFRTGTLRPGPIRRARTDLHWAVAPWLTEELAEVGLEARTRFLLLPSHLAPVSPPEQPPAPFTVLSYIPDQRWEFYDGPSVLAAAQALPDIRFEVIGGTGARVKMPPPNLVFFGWQSNIKPFLTRASVVVRLVRHDGMGGTVWEALEAGRHVIYSQRMPCVTVVPYADPPALVAALRELFEKFQAGELPPNHAGHRFVAETVDVDTCLGNYITDLHEHLGWSPIPENLRP